MKKIHCFMLVLFLWACGGSNSPTGPGGDPPDQSGGTPVVQNRSFTLSRLSIDSGASPLEITPPQATGVLQMHANGAYTLSFGIDVNNFIWSKTITGTHTFVDGRLQMMPVDSVKTTVEPFRQTVIVDTLSLVWQSDSRVVIPLPIRPGAWRSEDVISLTYTQSAVAKPGFVVADRAPEAFDYVSLLNALGWNTTDQ